MGNDMQFISIEFLVFLPLVFFAYWFLAGKNIQAQNCIIVLASYVFYGWWDWRFLLLIAASTFLDFFVGVKLGLTDYLPRRKLYLLLSVVANLSLLGFFKYFNFFMDSFAAAFTFLGNPIDLYRLRIILPVGISFYTFQTMSYSIDVYKRNMPPTNDFIAFSAYVSFFPQLVAGPIERATNLLPQFSSERFFTYEAASDGMRQILWGAFKKIVIADNCAVIANQIFASPERFSGSTLLLGAFFFAFQIYGDFSGYSDIAIGVSRLFGFKLMRNFANPYFSRDIAEFWRRWHISLSTWFRDYVYIPLGGSKKSKAINVRNTFIIFLLSGFWHGANWTFLVWGGLNALYFIPLMLGNKNRKNLGIVAEGHLLPSAGELLSMVTTFFMVLIAWVFFRADSVAQAMGITMKIFSFSLFEAPKIPDSNNVWIVLFLVSLFLVVEWFGREGEYAIQKIPAKLPTALRYAFYYSIAFVIVLAGGDEQQFIYFQF